MSANSVHASKARYRVTEQAYIDDVLYAASTDAAPVFVEYDGHPGTALEPVDDEGRERQAAYFARRGQTAEAALAEKRRLTEGTPDLGQPAEPATPSA